MYDRAQWCFCQEGDEGKGQRGKAETAAALAAQVPVKIEKDGNPTVAPDSHARHLEEQ